MKKFLLVGLSLLSINSFAQSYMVLQNGVILTTDKGGLVYDFQQFVMPYKVAINGGQFFVENDKLTVIDEKGFIYNKDMEVEKAVGKGNNYLINGDKDLITVAANGFVYKLKDEAFKKAIKFGGNFFVVTKDEKKKLVDLYTVNTKGNYFKITVPGLNPMSITLFGGNYFQASGITYTVDKDGIIYSKSMLQIPAIKKMGGNFFIDHSNQLWSISETGLLSTPVLPTTFNIANIAKIGSNYMVDVNGNLFTVDSSGNVSQRVLPNHDLRDVKVLSK